MPDKLLYLHRWVLFNQLFIGIMTLILFFIHVHNACYPMMNGGKTEPWCNPVPGSTFHCVGPNLIWSDGDRSTGDWNHKWRTVFTVKPEEFVDLWTPLVFALAAIYTHWSHDTKIAMISGSWVRVFIFHLCMALFCHFGYAGNFGVFLGFWNTIAFLPFVLVIAGLDSKSDTTVELRHYYTGYFPRTPLLMNSPDISVQQPAYNQPFTNPSFDDLTPGDRLANRELFDDNGNRGTDNLNVEENYLPASRSPSQQKPDKFRDFPQPNNEIQQNPFYEQQNHDFQSIPQNNLKGDL